MDDPLVDFVVNASERAAIGQAARAAGLGEPKYAAYASTRLPGHLLVALPAAMISLSMLCVPFAAFFGAIIGSALVHSGWVQLLLWIAAVIVIVLVVRITSGGRWERWVGLLERRWPTTTGDVTVVIFQDGFVCPTARGMAAVRWNQITRFQIHEFPQEWNKSGARSIRVLIDVATADRWRVEMRYETGPVGGLGLARMFVGRVPSAAHRSARTHKTRIIWDG